VSAAAAQNELPLEAPSTGCLVCGQDTRVHWTRLCVTHEQAWRHGPEYEASAHGQALREAMRGLTAEAAPGAAQARLLWLLEREQQDGDPEAVAAFVERVKADAAEAPKRAAKAAEVKLEAEVMEEVSRELLKLKKAGRLFYWRANSGGAWFGEQFVRANKSGTPDLICIVKVTKRRADGGELVFGVFLGLEAKRPGGKQNDAQVKWEREAREQGGAFYALVASAAEAVAAVECAARLEAPR